MYNRSITDTGTLPLLPPTPMLFPLTCTDAAGRTVHLPGPPERIVSLVPSQTELLAALGLDEAVVGLTRFCVHPEDWKARKTIVGGTKQADAEKVRALQPDLILANLEENTQAMVAELEELAPVYVTDVASLDDALAMIRTVGRLTGRPHSADALAAEIDEGFRSLPPFELVQAVYLIWQDPIMTVGHGTFIHEMLARAGLVNVFGERTRYPEVTLAAIEAARPDVLLLSSEPYPFAEAHVEAFEQALPGVAVRLVDGEPFSWYGSRLRATPAYLEAVRADLAAASEASEKA